MNTSLSYRPSDISRDMRSAWAGERTDIARFATLSILIHVFAVIAFGDAVGLRAAEGARLFGGFVARIQGPATSSAPPATAVPPTMRAPVAAPSAATRPPPASLTEPAAASSEPALTAPSSTAPATPDLVPLLAKDVVKPVTEFVIPPTPVIVEAADKPTPAPSSVPTATPRLEPAVPATRAARELAPALEVPLAINPAPPLAPVIRPAPARDVAVPFEAPLNVNPATPLAPIQRAEPARELAAPLEVAPQPVPITLPPTIAPTRAESPPRSRELAPAEPVALETPKAPDVPIALPPPIQNPARAAAPVSPAQTAREFTPYAQPQLAQPTAPAAAASAPAARVQPDAGVTNTPGAAAASGKTVDDIFGPRRDDNPRGTLGPAPKIDPDAARQRARELAAEERPGTGPKTLFKFPTPPPPVAKRKVEEVFDKALKRPDCKDEYANMGLAAIAPLVRDAVTQEGCKW
jgi:hypothetical protein